MHRVRGAAWLAIWLAVAPCAAAQTPDIEPQQSMEDRAKSRMTDWAAMPFTCRDLLQADANKDSSDEAAGNYDAILAWEAAFPDLAQHTDLDSKARLAQDVLQWCADLPNTGGNPNERLAEVVRKAWRMMGN